MTGTPLALIARALAVSTTLGVGACTVVVVTLAQSGRVHLASLIVPKVLSK